MTYSTIRDILVEAEQKFNSKDAIRYKVAKDTIAAKSYADLKADTESFSCVLEALGVQKAHVALTGMTSYPWLVSYFGIVNSGNVAVPLDVSLPMEEMCELIDRSDAVALVVDEIRKDVMLAAKQKCPKLRYLISMQKEVSDEEALSFGALLKEHKGSYDYKPNPEDLATIMFTSGTTGKSKGVMLTHRNMASCCLNPTKAQADFRFTRLLEAY